MAGMALSSVDVAALADVLRPSLATVPARRSLVELALGFGSPVVDRLDWGGDTQSFTVHLIGVLAAYGEVEPGRPALVAVLEALREQVGLDRQAAIDGLIARVRAVGSASGASGGPLTPGQRRRKADQLAELQARYDTLGRRIGALDLDIGRETDSMRRQVLEERKSDAVAERDAVAAEMDGLERELGAG